MIPILLKGHERPLTKIIFNHDGDLIFSSSKDRVPNVWYWHNGERLGTFDGHSGAIWDIAVSRDSKMLLTAGADAVCNLWEVHTGKIIHSFQSPTSVRCVQFAQGDKFAIFVSDKVMGKPSTMWIIKTSIDKNEILDEKDPLTQNGKDLGLLPGFINKIDIEGSKITSLLIGDLNKHIFTGHEDGSIVKWNLETGEELIRVHDHKAIIQDMQMDQTKGFFIAASRDQTAKLFDVEDLSVVKVFSTESPINSASISPIRPHVVLGGGQDAMHVTQTDAKEGKFEARFYHQILEEEIGRVKGHFGPINTLAFHPKGIGYASGSEDGFVRLHLFDNDYYKFKYSEETLAAAEA